MEKIDQLEQILDKESLLRSVVRDSFFDFLKTFWDTISQEQPVWNWHIEYLCNELQKMAERVFKNEPKEYDLVVNISPGTTKSTIMSVMFPAWCWTRMPNFQFIGVSYSEKLSHDLSMKTRDIVQSELYQKLFPTLQLREDQNTKGFFKNTHGGWRFSAGVGGTVTGYHAHFIVIDDPLNPNEAMSETDLNRVNRWVIETLSSRKVNKAVTPTALVMQRLHQDDPSAKFLSQKNVKHICLPARKTEDIKPKELEKFYSKGVMDPVRLPWKVLAEEESKGKVYFATQFLQRPTPPGGDMFQVDKIHEEDYVPDAVKFVKVVRYWDKAGTSKGGAYTCGVKMAIDEKNQFWILDVVRFRFDSAKREMKIEEVAVSDGSEVIIGVEQEPGSGGKESAENTVRNLAGFKVVVDKVDASVGSKEQRADVWSVQVNNGNVRVLKRAWTKDWKMEHEYFPRSKYKDQVDATTGAFRLLWKRKKRAGAMKSKTFRSLKTILGRSME